VKCWGLNQEGQLGDGSTTSRSTPVAVSGIAGAVEVGTGRYFSCARIVDGTVRCWGDNGSGQLGDGTSTDSLTPVTVSGISTATDIAIGDFNSCAALSSGSVMCWGSNNEGTVGDGTTTSRPAPVASVGVTSATQVSAFAHTCARLSTAGLQCWGSNGWAQVGTGSGPNRLTPVQVTGVGTVVAEVSTGAGHTCVRRTDGTLKCWGMNTFGQLGEGTTFNRTNPGTAPLVTGISTATRVSAGYYHSCALLSGGGVRCWGYNANGRLGNGTTQGSLVPVVVTIGEAAPPAPLEITTTSMPDGNLGSAYSIQVTATSGADPYSWALTAGSLPPGLSLTPTGSPSATLSGTPTSAGTFEFTVQVTDSADPAATDTQQLSVTISATPNPPLLDDFNRSSENPVSQDGNWASTGIGGGPGAPLLQNRLRNFPSPGYSYRVQPYLGGDMTAAATIATKPTSNNHWLSVFICLQDADMPDWDGYELRAINVTSGADTWQVWRVDDGARTLLAQTSFEMAVGGVMLLRRVGLFIEFWWKAPGGTWVQREPTDPDLFDTTYRWGMIGAGGAISGALDNFSGGSSLSLLSQYAPALRYDVLDSFRADSARMIAENDPPGIETSNVLWVNPGVPLASREPFPGLDQLSIDYLGSTYPPGGTAQGRNSTADDYIEAEDNHVADAQRMRLDPDLADRTYGRTVVASDGRVSIQYWFFYYFNWHPLPTDEGDHEGDWEMIQVDLDEKMVPLRATYAQHGHGEGCGWSNVETNELGRPAVYVARGSHASYFVQGIKLPNSYSPGDIAGGDVPPVTPSVVAVDSSPEWLGWLGQWGGDEHSPYGPAQKGEQWDAPIDWADAMDSCWEDGIGSAHLDEPSTAPLAMTELFGSMPMFAPTPEVTASRVGKRVRISYNFLKWPTTKGRRVVVLLTSVQSAGNRYAPFFKRHRISARRGVVWQPLGMGNAPFKLHAAAYSEGGASSRTVTVKISGG
jgi:hypothetical protein